VPSIQPIKEKVLPLIDSTAEEYVKANAGWPKRGSIVGGAAGTAVGDHAGTFYGGAIGGAVDYFSGRK
jgi:hypothetical protein